MEGEQGSAIHVVLQNVNTGHVVTAGPEASAKLDIVVLEGDFTADDEENWSQEDFENFVVRERDGKRPLLTGELSVALKDGVGTLGELTFTDNSSWIRSRKFRLGVRIASGNCEGIRIREAKTEAFTVKDHRGECTCVWFGVCVCDSWWSGVRGSGEERAVVWGLVGYCGVWVEVLHVAIWKVVLMVGSGVQCTRSIIHQRCMMRCGGWTR